MLFRYFVHQLTEKNTKFVQLAAETQPLRD